MQRFMRSHGLRTLIVTGAAGNSGARNQDVLERAVEAAGTIVAALNVIAVDTRWPFIVADARAMPFADASVDLVLASAIIEQVGAEAYQTAFVREQLRVRKAAVITTPNRLFPIESHTSVLFHHWSPRWRASRQEFTRLLSRKEFAALLPPNARIIGRPWSPTFTALLAQQVEHHR